MRVLDLFSGIGGFALGLERAGMQPVAFCEVEPYCRAVLRKHWPRAVIYADIRAVSRARLDADCIEADLICGGFPCQDISSAGNGAGIEGERSGLWREFARIVDEVRPRYVLVENVAALLGRGLGRVLGDLAALGFDAEWHCIPASAVGAPHRRDRVWVVAYADRRRRERERQQEHDEQPGASWDQSDGCSATGWGHRSTLADAAQSRLQVSASSVVLSARRWEEGRAATARGWWSTEPDVGRVAHGVPARVDRLRALGNALVPQIAEAIGRAIIARCTS